jgi:hypothetical protein
MDRRAELEALDRESLVVRAQEAGIRRARILTRPELIDELLRLDPEADEATLKRSRGFFGRARDLLTRVVERGLHLPDAIDRFRATGTLPPSVPRTEPVAVPTVTLAEIYAAQGHKQRAIETLERVLEREPDHAAARALLTKLTDAAYVAPEPPLPPEPEIEPAPPAQEEEPAAAAQEEEPAAAAQQEEPAGASEPEAADDEELTVEIDVPTTRFAECVAVPSGRGTIHVIWRVPGRPRHAGLTIRAVVITPSWDRPTTDVRDVEVETAAGQIVLGEFPARAVVRVAVGTMRGGAFVPVAHSPLFDRGDDGGFVCWTFRGTTPVALDDPRSTIFRAASVARGEASS